MSDATLHKMGQSPYMQKSPSRHPERSAEGAESKDPREEGKFNTS